MTSLIARQFSLRGGGRTEQSSSHGLGLNVTDLRKRFGDSEILQGVDLQIEPGSFLALVGRSGCGKSTLLRLMAGIDRPSSGEIRFSQADALDAGSQVRIMFQDARLLPWLDVLANVMVGVSDRAEPCQHALKALDAVGLVDRAREWPGVLSGGERQRVALARALAGKPRLLLLDEPMSALDALTRIEMQDLISRVWDEYRFTAVLVTHDVSEAITLADRAVVLGQGRIVHSLDITLKRPRERGTAAFAACEHDILARLLKPATMLAPTKGPN